MHGGNGIKKEKKDCHSHCNVLMFCLFLPGLDTTEGNVIADMDRIVELAKEFYSDLFSSSNTSCLTNCRF